MILQHLIPRLKEMEGWRSHLYIDTTSNLTIGYGLNLAHIAVVTAGGAQVDGGRVRLDPVNSIPQNIGELLLVHEVTRVVDDLTRRFPPFQHMDEVRHEVLVELGFNIGLGYYPGTVPKGNKPGILDYPGFRGQLERGEYAAAARNMRSWRWYKQVHARRAEPLCQMMETGRRP